MSAERKTKVEVTPIEGSQEALKNALALTRISIDHAQDMLYWICDDGTIADVNQATCDTLGYERDELLSMSIFSIDPRLTPESYREAWHELRRLGATLFETEHVTKAGRRIAVEVSRHIVSHEGREYNCAFAREIGARREAEERIAHLNRLLEAMRSVHQLIIREKDAKRLVEQVCELLVEGRGYTNAWILLSEGPLGPAWTVERGVLNGFPALARSLRAGDLPPCCVEALAAPKMIAHASFDCNGCPLSSSHEAKGVMTARLQHDAQSFGFLCVSTAEQRSQLQQERDLFQDIADDISFALNRLVLEHERDQAIARRIALARKVLATQEQERARVSRELHDELGQILTALHFELEMVAQAKAHGESSLEGVQTADAMVKEAVSELRRICRGLRPMVLDDLGLVPAIKGLVGELERRLALTVNWSAGVKEDGRHIAPELAVCVFRVVQEALTNIARHADAERIRVALSETEHEIELQVEDDGCGFVVDEQGARGEGGFGLQGMRERTDLVEGKLEISSCPGEGTLIRLVIDKETPIGGGA